MDASLKPMAKKTVHAFLPRLSSQLGHIFPYHMALQEALQAKQWSYRAYVPRKGVLPSLPPDWEKVLVDDVSDSPKSFFQKLKFLFLSILPYRKVFRAIEQDSKAVVFFEQFELPHLAAIALALFFLRPKFQFWILFRYDFEGKRGKAVLCRLFLRTMKRKFAKVNCLTDSDLLADVLRENLKCPLTVVPIPHTESATPLKREESLDRVLCWWPGGLIREDKGVGRIGDLLQLMKVKDGFQIVLAEKAKGVFGDHPCLSYIPTYLSPEEYIRWMQKADLILLPYSRPDYARRTSGIFVEAIVSGAIPVVTKGTWMAYELSKFHLEALTFDWAEKDLLDRLEQLRVDKSLRQKLDQMRAYYRSFHTKEGFAAVWETLFCG